MNESMNINHNLNNDFSDELLQTQLIDLIDNKDIVGLNELLDDVSSLTICNVFSELESEKIIQFFFLCTNYPKLGALFSYLPIETRIYLSKFLPKKNMITILSFVKDDDLADFLEDINKVLRNQILSYLPFKRRKNIIQLSKYSNDTIGSIMTCEYLAVNANSTIEEVFKKIKEVGKNMETIRTIFVTDKTNHLLGVQSLEAMMFEEISNTIEKTMSRDFPYISPIADKENAVSIFKKYDLAVLPVVSKNNDMLGIITFDDVLDVIEEENTEDIYKQSAISPSSKTHREEKIFRIALSYVMWLIILLVINTFASMIVDKFESELYTIPVLLSFLPVLNDTGGNSGDQTTATITRALAVDEISTKDYLKVLLKETIAGFLIALTVGLISFGWTMVELNTPILNVGDTLNPFIASVGGNKQFAFVIIAIIISSSLFFAVLVSKMLGATLPIVAKKCHIDPAIISGPLITSIMDILTLLIYFSLAKFIIDKFDPGEIAVVLNYWGSLL